MKLSVVIATYNEEENIGRCLKSVEKIVDEIIIVDGQSTDNTVSISNKYGAIIISTTNKPNFHINKQIGLDKARGKWILQLDADEVISPHLADEIFHIISLTEEERQKRRIHPKKEKLFSKHQSLIEQRDGNFSKKSDNIAAYFLPRSNMFLGRKMRYAGMYPDGVIRLVKRGKAKFPCKSVHEQIQIDGRVGWLENDLIHYDSPTFQKYLTRANRYTSLTAQELKKSNTLINLGSHIKYLFTKPLSTFLNLYFRHKGILDGFPGFVFSLFSGFHFTWAYMKYLGDK